MSKCLDGRKGCEKNVFFYQPACSNMRLENETYMLDFFPQKVCMCNWGLNSEPGSHLFFSLDFLRCLRSLRRDAHLLCNLFCISIWVQRDTKKGHGELDTFLGGIPGLRSMFGTGCTLGFVLPSFAIFPLNDQRTICYFLEIFLVGCIFPVTKAKAWPQTPEELASLEIGESEATQYV